MTVDKIAAFLSEAHGLSANEAPGPETSLLQSGLVDSLGMVELILFLEATFGIAVGDEDLVPENFETISAMARFVEAKQGQSARPEG